jgi:lysophospholipase L1-like esterase
MKIAPLMAVVSLSLSWTVPAQLTETKPNDDPYFAPLYVLRAPQPQGPVLRRGDRLAICGDSITEQRMYSRILETYLTVALPELNISTRQYGWSGEQASGFLQRMTNDVLRFHPTVATTCYGMNDFHYKPYELAIGQVYASNMTEVVSDFENAGTRVVVGSPGCMGFSLPPWGNFVKGTFLERNASLCALRDIDINISQIEHTGFADVFWDMYTAQYVARERYGTNYTLAGKDSVHPGWAGHLIMAYAFLKALDVPGDIGTFTVDLRANKATVSAGHELISFQNGALTIRSTRYPFCATGQARDSDSIRSGMALAPFNRDFNRLMLIVKGAKSKNIEVSWGPKSRTYSAAELGIGVNLAEDFDTNPFSEAFAAVDQAVAKKQEFETDQIKKQFHGDAGKADMEKTVIATERAREPLVAAIKAAFIPVTHTITITQK